MIMVQKKRADAKLSAQEVASRAKISQSKLSKIEHGKLQLKLADAVRLAHILGCSTDDLYLDDEGQQPTADAHGVSVSSIVAHCGTDGRDDAHD